MLCAASWVMSALNLAAKVQPALVARDKHQSCFRSSYPGCWRLSWRTSVHCWQDVAWLESSSLSLRFHMACRPQKQQQQDGKERSAWYSMRHEA